MSGWPLSPASWQTGLSLEAYVSGMQHHQAATRRRLARATLRPEDRAALGRLTHVRYVLVMTEDWCGDSLMNVPIVAHIAAAVPGLELRVFPRAGSPELDRYYQSRGITHIPVVTFLDPAFRALATWVERPQGAHTRLAAWNAAHPEVAAVRNNPDLDPDERRRQLREATAGLLDEMEGWYEGGLQQETIDEIKRLLIPQFAES